MAKKICVVECAECRGELEFIVPDDFHYQVEYCPFCGSSEVQLSGDCEPDMEFEDEM